MKLAYVDHGGLDNSVFLGCIIQICLGNSVLKEKNLGVGEQLDKLLF